MSYNSKVSCLIIKTKIGLNHFYFLFWKWLGLFMGWNSICSKSKARNCKDIGSLQVRYPLSLSLSLSHTHTTPIWEMAIPMPTLMALSSPPYTTNLFRPTSQLFFSKSKKIQCSSSSINKEEPSTPQTKSFNPKRGVSVYKPKSYQVLVNDAAVSLAYALQDGNTRLEIDFP